MHTLAGGALAADGDADSDAHDSDDNDVPAAKLPKELRGEQWRPVNPKLVKGKEGWEVSTAGRVRMQGVVRQPVLGVPQHDGDEHAVRMRWLGC